MNERISLHICTKNRPTELALLLQSLRTQNLDRWDLIIIDESENPITNSGFVMKIISRIKLENHKVKIIHNPISLGVCHARNLAIDNDTYNNLHTARLDDDSILEPDCLYELWFPLHTKEADLVGGVIPNMFQPEVIRNCDNLGTIINEHKLDKKGDLIENKDECGYCYNDRQLIPTHQFRTFCMYKSELHKKVKYPTKLSNVGFREEGFFSFKAILEGYKLVINTQAKAYHMICEIGGCRDNEYAAKVQSDDTLFRKWIKDMFEEHGDFLSAYNEKVKEE